MSSQGHTGDRRLVELCISRDLGAWEMLVSKYSRLVEIAASRRLKKYGFTLSNEDMADIRQDVFEIMWRKEDLKDVAGLDDISHWIAVVSGNIAISHMRSGKNKIFLHSVSIYEKFKEKYFAEILPSGPLKPEDDAAEKELEKIIDGAIAALPCRERLIIELFLIHGKKHSEIADLLDLPDGTVSSYVKRAKDRLKAALREFLIIFAIISAILTTIYMRG